MLSNERMVELRTKHADEENYVDWLSLYRRGEITLDDAIVLVRPLAELLPIKPLLGCGNESVYIIQHGETSWFKIGKTSGSLRKVLDRLSALQSGNPVDLHLFGYIRCSDSDTVEDRIHCLFHKHHHQGEWFDLSPERLQFIAEMHGFRRGEN